MIGVSGTLREKSGFTVIFWPTAGTLILSYKETSLENKRTPAGQKAGFKSCGAPDFTPDAPESSPWRPLLPPPLSTRRSGIALLSWAPGVRLGLAGNGHVFGHFLLIDKEIA
jgi:hypothetical protein